MIYDQTKAILKIEELGLPNLFKDIWLNKQPEMLEDFRKPETFIYLQQNYDVNSQGVFENFLALWEVNGDYVIGLNLKENSYLKYWFEDDIDKYKTIAEDYQTFIGLNLVGFIEEEDTEEVKTIAKELSFKYFDFLTELIHKIQTNESLSYDDIKEKLEEKIRTSDSTVI